MTRTAKPFAFLLGAAVAAGVAVPASSHAGAFEFIDEMFTFREDQKARVAPRRHLPPVIVNEPYYDPKAAESWNSFYTRTDLTPQNYIDGSGSMVMRPPAPATTMPTPMASGYIPEPVDGPQEADSSVYIGDPGDLPDEQGTGDIGRKTRIGTPMKDWRTGGADALPSRLGDYDHRSAPRLADDTSNDDLATMARSEQGKLVYGDEPAQPETRGFPANSPRYVARNAKGQVTKYKVQGDDTLSSIASQPAIYSNWKLWPLIYSANRKVIGHNPADLDNGDVLAIPRNYTKAQAASAEKKAMGR